jgi:tetratricopeptide (TPR) repeat protein
MYHRGIVERDGLKAPSVALQTFDQCVGRFPASAYAADALVAECRTGIALRDLALIDSARARLAAMNADGAHIQEAQFERAEFYNQVHRDREGTLAEYAKVLAEGLPADTAPALLAKARIADLVPGGDFARSIALYREVADNPKAPRRVRQWSVLHTGICQFVLRDEAAARETLEAFVAAEPPKSFESQARQFLDGMANPETTTGLAVEYDRGIRCRETETGVDRCFWSMSRVIALSRKPFFDAFVRDVSVDREQRAQVLYRLCFAYFMTGSHDKALALSERILSEIQPEGSAKWETLYMRAHELGRAGRWSEALPCWQQILEARVQAEIAAQAYIEYSRALHLSGDPLGAVLALTELTARYPGSIEAEAAGAMVAQHLLTNPGLVQPLDEARPVILAKWKRPPGQGVRPPPLPPDEAGYEVAGMGGAR